MNLQLLDLSFKLVGTLTLVITAILAVRRFGLQRESATFLRVLIQAQEVAVSNSLILTKITVKLDNLGQTRIDARRAPRDVNGLLYDDGWDLFRHAGTLKLRRIPSESEPLLFDWYSLAPLTISSSVSVDADSRDKIIKKAVDLEQINYLDDYQDRASSFEEAHFWLEPKESYELTVFLWLSPGVYAAKASFLGKEFRHENEEYWTHVNIFSIRQS